MNKGVYTGFVVGSRGDARASGKVCHSLPGAFYQANSFSHIVMNETTFYNNLIIKYVIFL